MRCRFHLLIACGVISTACASHVAGGTRGDADVRAKDLAAIQKLREQDIAATLAFDAAAIAELWTDDVVLLARGQPAEVGKQAILASRLRRQAAMPGFRVVSYVPKMNKVTIADGWAVDWGEFTATYVASPGAKETHVRARLLRVFEKQPDGSWKAAVGISNPAE